MSNLRETVEGLRQRLIELILRLGPDAHPGNLRTCVDEVLIGWSDRARYYHGIEHLLSCLGRFDQWVALNPYIDAIQRDSVELALFYHDAVYQVGRTNGENEKWSAAMLVDHAEFAGFGGILLAEQAVRETAYVPGREAPSFDDPAIRTVVEAVWGCDLGGIGGSWGQFTYEGAQVLRELGVLPGDKTIQAKRALFLHDIIEAGYLRGYWHGQYADGALRNTARLLAECLRERTL